MSITLLGTGAAGGVPLYGCPCGACTRARTIHKHVRRPSCALVESGSTRVLLDAGLMDLSERFVPGDLDAIVLTHFHPDHVQGLLHLRWGKSQPLPVYCPPDEAGCADLFRHPGFLAFSPVGRFDTFQIGDLKWTPLQLVHSKLTYGYFIEDVQGHTAAYLTDTIGLPDRTLAWLQKKSVNVVFVDATYPPDRAAEAINHNTVAQAIEIGQAICARQTVLTHLGHTADAWIIENTPKTAGDVRIGMDGDRFVFQ